MITPGLDRQFSQRMGGLALCRHCTIPFQIEVYRDEMRRCIIVGARHHDRVCQLAVDEIELMRSSGPYGLQERFEERVAYFIRSAKPGLEEECPRKPEVLGVWELGESGFENTPVRPRPAAHRESIHQLRERLQAAERELKALKDPEGERAIRKKAQKKADELNRQNDPKMPQPTRKLFR